MRLSNIGETFEKVVKSLVSVVLSSDILSLLFSVSFGIASFGLLIRILRVVVDEPFPFSLLDWIKEKFQRDGKSSDKAENMDLMHIVEDHEPFVRSIKIVNVLLDRVMFEYVGDYAISERKDTMTIYYNENGEAKQFSFNKSSHIEVYEDVVE